MSATLLSDPMHVTTSAPEPPPLPQAESEFVKCECCGLTEECTPSYIETVRECFMGKWICGLCSEAVKYEVIRTETLISTEEAMARHTSLCNQFKSSTPPPDPTVHLISVMRHILRKSLESPRSTPGSPTEDGSESQRRPPLSSSESCFATLTGCTD